MYLFYFLGAVAAGSLIGGFLGDKVGRKFIIWFSILGAAPFALWLPYADATTTAVLIVLIGFIISSAFASENRNDFRLFLRFCFWYGRIGFGSIRQIDRHNQY